tara:strand:+ start:58945 stop:59184 length:240 start_codon:yes stop_codon:yes gene_type:complete
LVIKIGNIFELKANKTTMNFKKIFGPFLSILGLGALIYGAYLFLVPENGDWKIITVSLVLGFVFFSSGLGLLKTMKDES